MIFNKIGYVYVNNYFQVKYGLNKLSADEHYEETYKKAEEDEKILLDKELGKKNEISNINVKVEDDESQKGQEKLLDALKKGVSDEPVTNGKLDTEINVYKNIYALGDIIESNEEKLASIARVQGVKVANNIYSVEYGLKPDPYFFGSSEILMFISTGQTGVFVKGDKALLSGKSVILMKNSFESLFITQYTQS